MTHAQEELLTHIFLQGPEDLYAFSGRVINDCARKGWIEIDLTADYPYGHTAADNEWVLTDAGRRALHEAQS